MQIRGKNMSPDKDSKRSKRRKKRGFISLSESSRKHRRANDRLSRSCVIDGIHVAPGTKREGGKGGFVCTGGGSINYHA